VAALVFVRVKFPYLNIYVCLKFGEVGGSPPWFGERDLPRNWQLYSGGSLEITILIHPTFNWGLYIGAKSLTNMKGVVLLETFVAAR